MAVLVQKYGGSSVADVEKVGQVADRIVAAKRAGHDVVVVVSAMGKTTDELLALAKRVAADPPRRELDMLVSTGERVSMALLSIAIHARGGDAISFTGSQSGIITSDRHFDARILEVRPHRIEEELARGKIVIVAGYQGMSTRREITTLGRGGSDTTAVALAAALGAERCEIYSDVDGVYSADPRVVPDARHLPELDLASLQEMSEAGAKVLNAQAVEWARRAGIAIHARRTSDPVGGGRETVCAEREVARGGQEVVPEPRHVRAVVGLDRVVHARVTAGELRAFADLCGQLDLPLLDVAAWGDAASCAIPLLNVPDWERCRGRLEEKLRGALSLEAGCAVVSVVGDGLTTGARALPRMLAVLDELRAPPRAVHAGPLRLGATIEAAHLADVQRALHAAFVP
ncbi:MAG TPA: aspartate kinase [Polyangiaceae bacterium]|jgi:aspartate kinase